MQTIVENYLNASVDDRGNSSTYSGGQKRTRVSWLIASHMRDHIDPITKNAISTVTQQARDVVSKKIAQFVSEQMVPAIEIKK